MPIDSVNSNLVLTKNECDNLIAQALKKPLTEAQIYHKDGLSQNANIRSVKGTDVTNEALRQFVMQLFKKMNPLQLDISGVEPIQLFKYETGDHYGWHTDWSPVNNKKRKLSMTIQLSESDSYTGGDMEILDAPVSRIVEKNIGFATVFPAWAVHRVRPIESGIRWSLVAWATGKPLK
jgi:PKHD-type hydroxylase